MDRTASTHEIEDVRDYPRPPRVELAPMSAQVWIGNDLVCDATEVMRVLETHHPPGIYLRPGAFAEGVLQPASDPRPTWCEWKGVASYFDLHAPDGSVVERGAWTYHSPQPGFEAIAGMVAVYPGRVTRCLLDDHDAYAQPGDFYGGWMTSWITGPVKGAPGTEGW